MKDMNMFCMISLLWIALVIGVTVESVANIYGFYFGNNHTCEGATK